MAMRNIALVSIGAAAVVAAVGWGVATLGTTPVVQVQESTDPAWRVNVEEMKHAEAVGLEESSEPAAQAD
jgi:hypothetical protein